MEKQPSTVQVALIQPQRQQPKSPETKSELSNTHTPHSPPSELAVPVVRRPSSPYTSQPQSSNAKMSTSSNNSTMETSPNADTPTSPCTLQVETPFTKRPISPGTLQATSAFHSPQGKFLASQRKLKVPVVSTAVRRSSSPNSLHLQVPQTSKGSSRRGSAASLSPSTSESDVSGSEPVSGVSRPTSPNVRPHKDDVTKGTSHPKPAGSSSTSKKELKSVLGIAVKSAAGRSGLAALLGGSGRKISWLKAYKSAKCDRQLNQVTRSADVEEVIVNLLAEREGVSVTKFWNVITSTGLRPCDPRLRECRDQIGQVSERKTGPAEEVDVMLDKDTFKRCISENIWVIGRAFKKDLVIPEFRGFQEELRHIYLRCKANTAGEVASAIPQLSRVDPDKWGVAVCTVDGQRAEFGDTAVPFCLESCAMPFNYALAVSELGADVVHRWVGFEPSGRHVNDLSLNVNLKPFNPLVNAGAIVILSMLRKGSCPADRFDDLFKSYKKLAGGEHVGFNNAVYLSDKDNSDRNYAIVYNLQEYKCTPGTPLLDTLDFLFQMSSVEVTAESGAVMAATLANGGICPITGQRVLTGEAVRDTLSLMHCCGMYDYSGHFAFKVGLPAKSGMGGVILLVVPQVMGICCYSPRLDHHGNSIRGLQFCEELVQVFTFHNYDSLSGSGHKVDPRLREQETSVSSVVKLLYGASVGDITTLRRFALTGMDMSCKNYDDRTALHVAAAQGHLHIVRFLVEKCSVTHDITDRWGHTPVDDARKLGRTDVVDYLEKRFDINPPMRTSNDGHVTSKKQMASTIQEE